MIKHWLHCLKTIWEPSWELFWSINWSSKWPIWLRSTHTQKHDWPNFSGHVTFGQSKLKCFWWRLTKTPFCQSAIQSIWVLRNLSTHKFLVNQANHRVFGPSNPFLTKKQFRALGFNPGDSHKYCLHANPLTTP